MNPRIALGTVQFGLEYGIANDYGKMDYNEARSIVELGFESGMDTLDTAINYGNSEEILGRINVENWKVVSKLPPVPNDTIDIVSWLNNSLQDSLERLRISKLYGLLLHRSNDLLKPQGRVIYDQLNILKEEGKIKKLGVSIYSPSELDNLLPSFKFDLVQAPFNILDQRLYKSFWLQKLFDSGVEIHTRSCFLQGLLLLDDIKRPKKFNSWFSVWKKWSDWLSANHISPIEACINFVMNHQQIHRVIIGVDNLKQLNEIINIKIDSKVNYLSDFASEDLNLIDPSRWG